MNLYSFSSMSSSSSESRASCASSSSGSSITNSPPTHPIQIGFTPRGSDALLEIFGASSTSISSSTCAFPSWPTSGSLGSSSKGSRGGAYLSDEELFGNYCDDRSNDLGVLSEAPEPPRGPQEWLAQPLLPLVASERPRQARRGSKKIKRFSKALSPIKETSV